jgi:hypothetical protein
VFESLLNVLILFPTIAACALMFLKTAAGLRHASLLAFSHFNGYYYSDIITNCEALLEILVVFLLT